MTRWRDHRRDGRMNRCLCRVLSGGRVARLVR
jgi:hypothetical protein